MRKIITIDKSILVLAYLLSFMDANFSHLIVALNFVKIFKRIDLTSIAEVSLRILVLPLATIFANFDFKIFYSMS